MAEEEPKKVESEPASAPPPPAHEPVVVEVAKGDLAEEKAVIPSPLPPTEEDCKALAVVEKPEPEPGIVEPAKQKKLDGSLNRDEVLARVETEKRLSLIRAWEESEKSKAENKAQKKLSAVAAWEISKEAALEAELKKIQEKLEMQKAEYVEKMNNKLAMVHKSAEEKRAIIEAKKGENILKAEELAAKYRAKGTTPKKLLGIF